MNASACLLHLTKIVASGDCSDFNWCLVAVASFGMTDRPFGNSCVYDRFFNLQDFPRFSCQDLFSWKDCKASELRGRFEWPAQKWQSANWDVASTNGLMHFCSFHPAVSYYIMIIYDHQPSPSENASWAAGCSSVQSMKASNNFNVGSCSCPRKRLRSTPRASEKALSQAKHKTSLWQWLLNVANTSNVSFLVLYMQKQYQTIEKSGVIS